MLQIHHPRQEKPGKRKTLFHSFTNFRSYITFTFSSAFPRLIRGWTVVCSFFTWRPFAFCSWIWTLCSLYCPHGPQYLRTGKHPGLSVPKVASDSAEPAAVTISRDLPKRLPVHRANQLRRPILDDCLSDIKEIGDGCGHHLIRVMIGLCLSNSVYLPMMMHLVGCHLTYFQTVLRQVDILTQP